jgi:serine/threonine protein kinase
MKELLDNWREFQKLSEQINTLDSGKRFIGNRLLEVTAPYTQIQIGDEELKKLIKWGKLKGEPEFLGSGSKGIAYKFENKVLKITEDMREAEACSLIAGKYHPNVYDIHVVGRRSEEDRTSHLHNMPFVIVYEFLDYPNKLMADVTQIMYHKVRKNNLYYNWDKNSLQIFDGLIKKFLKAIRKNPEILGEPVGKYNSIQPKLERILNELGYDNEKKTIFIELFTLVGGMYNSSLNNFEELSEYVKNILDHPKMIYFQQLANGLTFLASNGIIFTDLKNTNVMQKDGQLCIIDIGKSNVKGNPAIKDI